jgi:hypothetical protein
MPKGAWRSALWRPIPLTSRGAEKECGPCDNGRWVPRRLRTAEIRVRLPTNAAAIPGLQVHWIPRHCIRSFGFRCMISSSELLAAAFFRSVPRQAEYTWWASKMSWSVVASPAVLRRAFGASPWSPCHPRKSGARGKSRHNLFAQMKSGQDSADEVALPSQDRKGPSIRANRSGKELPRDSRLPPGPLQVGRGKLIQNFEIYRLLRGSGRKV